MRIVVVDPNTTASMTETIRVAAVAAASPGTEVVALTPAMGPASIESHHDEALAVPGLLDAIRSEPADGHVVACFGDPGLDAARELAAGPVVGIARRPCARPPIWADAIVLGCAGMADLCAHISAVVGVPVVDGVAAATRAVESLVALGLTTGKRGEFAVPPRKPYAGILDTFGR